MSRDPGASRDPAKNYPFYDVAAQVEAWAERGGLCLQKFTCAGCGSRQTIEEPNTFYTQGQCEECEHITDLRIAGCNFMLVLRTKEDPYGPR